MPPIPARTRRGGRRPSSRRRARASSGGAPRARRVASGARTRCDVVGRRIAMKNSDDASARLDSSSAIPRARRRVARMRGDGAEPMYRLRYSRSPPDPRDVRQQTRTWCVPSSPPRPFPFRRPPSTHSCAMRFESVVAPSHARSRRRRSRVAVFIVKVSSRRVPTAAFARARRTRPRAHRRPRRRARAS